MGRYLAVLWLAVSSAAWAQSIIPLPTAIQQCTELPVPQNPTTGKQYLYCKAGSGWCSLDASGTERCTGGAGGSGYSIIQDETVPLTSRTVLNFAGAGVTCADDAGIKTTCTIPGGGGGGTVTSVDCLSGLTCTPDPIVGAGTIEIGPGQVTDAMLANNYSGVGACGANLFASTLNDNAAPTCTQVNFTNLAGSATDAQVPNILTLDLPSSTLTGIADDQVLVGGGVGTSAYKTVPNCTAASCALNYTQATNTWGTNTAIAASTATALAADPSDCGANQFAQSIVANGNLTCAQPNFTDLAGTATDAQVPNTITLDNITQVTTRSHSSLQNLSADDHTQYLLLAGRATGQLAKGGTAAGDDLTLQSTNNASKGDLIFDDHIVLWPNVPALTSATLDIANFNVSYGATATTPTWAGIKIGPSFNQTADAPGLFGYFWASGTFTRGNDGTPADAVYVVNGFKADILHQSNGTNGTPPLLQDQFMDNGISELTAGTASTQWEQLSFVSQSTLKASGTANLTVYGMGFGAAVQTADVAVGATLRIGSATRSSPSGCAGDACDLQGRVGIIMRDITKVGTGTLTIDNNVGYACNAMTLGTNIACFRSDIAAASGRYNIQAAGTAVNFMSGGLRIGDAAITAPTNKLEVTNAAATVASIEMSGTITGFPFGINMFPAGLTVGSAGAYVGINATPTVTVNAAPNVISTGNFFNDNTTLQNDSGNARTLTGYTSYSGAPVFNANNAALTMNNGALGDPASIGFRARPTWSRAGTPTSTSQQWNSFTSYGGTIGAGWTVADYRGFHFKAPTVTGTVTNMYGLDIEAPNGSTNISARIAATAGNEVLDLTSVATNDDPTEKTFQFRTATTDATVTTAGSFAVASGRAIRLMTTIVAHCTGGASCTANQSAGYTIFATCRNNGGTTAVATGSPTQTGVHEDTAGWDATIDCDDTSDTARIRLTGAATTNITWHVTTRNMDVGT